MHWISIFRQVDFAHLLDIVDSNFWRTDLTNVVIEIRSVMSAIVTMLMRRWKEAA